MFSTPSRESKFFPALMKVCDGHFKDAKSKEEAITSVSLADNALANVSSVTTLARTFPALKNLDLSRNQIKNLDALEAWRSEFCQLDHLILSGNAIEAEQPTYQQDLLKWYPSLTQINQHQISPPGFALPGDGKSEEQLTKEKLVLEMTRSTGMTLTYSYECLELVGWSPEGAMNAFLAAKVKSLRSARRFCRSLY